MIVPRYHTFVLFVLFGSVLFVSRTHESVCLSLSFFASCARARERERNRESVYVGELVFGVDSEREREREGESSRCFYPVVERTIERGEPSESREASRTMPRRDQERIAGKQRGGDRVGLMFGSPSGD